MKFFYNSYLTFYKWLKLKKKIVGFQKSTNGYEGMCMSEKSFLSHDKWEIKLLRIFPIYIQPFTKDSNSTNNNFWGFKNSQMDMAGCVWLGRKFLKEWQVTGKIIEGIFSQFAFNHLWMSQTQEIITCRVLKIYE